MSADFLVYSCFPSNKTDRPDIIEILIIGGVNCLQLEQQPVHVEFYNVLKKTSCQLSLSVFVVGYIRSY